MSVDGAVDDEAADYHNIHLRRCSCKDNVMRQGLFACGGMLNININSSSIVFVKQSPC